MAASKPKIITHEEFEKRLEINNERLRQELAEAQERVQQLELLVARKESFAQRLTSILTEIEQEEDEIAALEQTLIPRKRAKAYRAWAESHRRTTPQLSDDAISRESFNGERG